MTTITKTGWINGDRYYSMPTQLLELVQAQESENASVYVINPREKFLVPCSRNPNGMFVSVSLPKGMNVSVVAIKVENGKALYARRDVAVGSAALAPMTYKTLTVSEMREELNKLNI